MEYDQNSNKKSRHSIIEKFGRYISFHENNAIKKAEQENGKNLHRKSTDKHFDQFLTPQANIDIETVEEIDGNVCRFFLKQTSKYTLL